MASCISVKLLSVLISSTAFSSALSSCPPDQWKIVGLFNPFGHQDRAVQLAYSKSRTGRVCYESFRPFSMDTSESWQEMCRLLSGGLLSLIADQPLPNALNDIIDAVQIPVVSTAVITTNTNSTVVSIAPSEEQLANALSQLMLFNSWTSVVLITWQGSGLELFMPGSISSYGVAAVYYTDTSDAVLRSKIIKIKQSSSTIIVLHHYDLQEVLRIFSMAAEESLVAYPYIWILSGQTTDMLMGEISSGHILSSLPRLLGMYQVVPSNPQLGEFAKTWKSYGSVKQLQSAAYLYDAFNILSHTVDNATSIAPNFTQIQQPCDMLTEWQFGRSFQTLLKETEETLHERLTAGTNSVYHYISIDQYGFNKVATWTTDNNELNIISPIRWCSRQELTSLPLCQGGSTSRCSTKTPPSRTPPNSAYQFDYRQYSFDVVTVELEPFVFITIEDGREVYQGLCIDLLNMLSEILGFTYRINLVEDGQFGGELEDGSWTGVVGDLTTFKAEVAVAPLTVTSMRQSVIDFTNPYYDVGLKVLYNVEDDGDQFSVSTLFLFIMPFKTEVWLLIILSMVVVSATVAVIGRLSPYDWYHNIQDGYGLWESRFQMTLYNSWWQALSAVLQQGAETAPRSISGRILMGGWWFVCLVLAAAFTANLTAAFATEDSESLFDSIDELVSSIPPNIPFGTYSNTQSAEFFQFSEVKHYREAYQYMVMEGLLFDTEDEALNAVLHKNVALIEDGPVVEFLSNRRGPYNPNCTLKAIGSGQFSPGGYAFGFTKNSPYTNDFSLAILELRERGAIEGLTEEYFEYRQTCSSEVTAGTSASMYTKQIDFTSYGGLFIILGMGIVLSFIVLLGEYAFKHLKNKVNKHERKQNLLDQEESPPVICKTSTEL